ncbi:MAG: PP2C family protein-serine/threonine phosphatase [Ilumatobacteraceae bacterium]
MNSVSGAKISPVKTARRFNRLPAVITLVGFAVFAGLAVGCRLLYNQSESRLLKQRTAEAGAALQLSVAQVRLPLDAAAKLAKATTGDPASLTTSLAAVVGEGKTFTAAALYRIGSTTPVAQIGDPAALSVTGANSASAMLQRATSEPFVVIDLLGGGQRRLGYAVADSATHAQYVVYGERTLSADPYVRRRTDQPFSQLDYAIYYGKTPSPDQLLGSSVRNLPISGRHADQVIPFGDGNLLLVMTPIGYLSGWLFANLWWMVATFGVLASLAFGALTKGLLDRRDTALRLALDNERLYSEQRQIAETLQLSLLPDQLAAPVGVEVAARYWPAGSANLIGGDFYDHFAVGDDRWAVAIGDVCGKGIEAASLTGLARHTLRAAARQSNSVTDVLLSVHNALRDHQPPTFCTACFGFIWPTDDGCYRLELSLGGHPQPLLRRADGHVEAIGTRGTLLGMIEPSLVTSTADLRPGDTLVFYTDGLTDAPAHQAVSVEELTSVLEHEGDQPIEQLADSIRAVKRHRRPLGSGDDTALLIVRLAPHPQPESDPSYPSLAASK